MVWLYLAERELVRDNLKTIVQFVNNFFFAFLLTCFIVALSSDAQIVIVIYHLLNNVIGENRNLFGIFG